MATAEMATSTPVAQAESRIVISNVSWADYEALGKIFEDRPSPRMTYDRGTLELSVLSYTHEALKSLFGAVVTFLCFALARDSRGGGSTTFKRELVERGLEPDQSYWFANEAAMRGKWTYDPEIDPPPDLAIEIEIDISRPGLAKLDLYAALGFPEIWRFDGETLRVHRLQEGGVYAERERGENFPEIAAEDVVRWVRRGAEVSEQELGREIVAWVNAGMPPKA